MTKRKKRERPGFDRRETIRKPLPPTGKSAHVRLKSGGSSGTKGLAFLPVTLTTS